MTGDRWGRRALAFIALLAAMRLVITWWPDITDTEAYYADWARWPALSYYDHPPLLAWTTWVVSHLLGWSAFVVRLVPSVSIVAFGVLVHRFAARMFSPRAAFLGLIVVSVLPAFLGAGVLVNPEAVLAPLWMLVLTALWDLAEHDEWWRPIVLGGAIGVAFLAKYTGLLAVPLAIGWVASTRDTRRWLRRPSFYAAGFVALAIASPVIVWNAARGFPSVRLHLVDRVAHASLTTWVADVPRILLPQVVLFHPLAFVGFVVVAVVSVSRGRSDLRFRFLAWTALPVLAFFVLMMFRVRDAEAHWTMVGYVPLAVGMGALLDEVFELRRARVYLGAIVVSSALALGVFLLHMGTSVVVRLVPDYDPNADGVNETFGWKEIAAAVSRNAGALGDGAVVASHHNVLCGHLDYALADSPPVYCASAHRTEFDFVGRRNIPPGAPVVYVDSARYPLDPSVALGGRSCTKDERVTVMRAGRAVQSIRIWSCPTASARAPERQASR